MSTNNSLNFGVDLLPQTTEEYNLGSATKKWNIFANEINGITPVLTSETASSGGTTLSLVTTGEKYTWNNNVTTTADTSHELYVVGVTSNATTTLKHNTKIKIKNDTLIASGVGSSLGQISYPNVGVYMTGLAQTGALQIKIPHPGSSAGIISFDVNIVTYTTSGTNIGKTMATYHCGGFLTTTNNTWNAPDAAYCYSTGVGPLTDLQVSFRNDGTDRYILIGTTDTHWYLPQVSISNIMIGRYSQTAARTQWLTDWTISFVTTLPGSANDKLITHPNTFNATFPINQINGATANRIMVSDANGVVSELAAGTAGQVLTSNGSSAPTWETPTSSSGNSVEIIRL